MHLPEFAVSIPQPYASLIIAGVVPVFNRSYRSAFRGPIAVHASAFDERVFGHDFEAIVDLCAERGIPVPKLLSTKLPFGGIIGSVNLVDCVEHHASPWFTGEFGFVMESSEACELVPCTGQPGTWRWDLRRA